MKIKKKKKKKKIGKLGIVFLSDVSPAYHTLTINIYRAQFLACPRLLVIGRGEPGIGEPDLSPGGVHCIHYQ